MRISCSSVFRFTPLGQAFCFSQFSIHHIPITAFLIWWEVLAQRCTQPCSASTLARGGRAARPCAIQSEIQVSGREEGSLAALLDEKGGAGLLQGTCHANVCRRMDEPRHAFFAHLLGVCECCTVSLASVRALSVGISGWRA